RSVGRPDGLVAAAAVVDRVEPNQSQSDRRCAVAALAAFPGRTRDWRALDPNRAAASIQASHYYRAGSQAATQTQCEWTARRVRWEAGWSVRSSCLLCRLNWRNAKPWN